MNLQRRKLWLLDPRDRLGLEVGLPVSGLPLWPGREESVSIRHFDLRQARGVQGVTLLDNAVPIEKEGHYRVHHVWTERGRLIERHRAVETESDIVVANGYT